MKLIPKSAACFMLAASVAFPASYVLAAEPSTQPAPAPTSQPSRSEADIVHDLLEIAKTMQAAGRDPATLANATKRAAAAPTLIPLVKKQITLANEYAAVSKKLSPAMVAQMTQHNIALLYLLGDADTTSAVNSAAAGADLEKSVTAQTMQLEAQWLAAGTDQDAQARIVDHVEALDRANPTNTNLTIYTFSLSQTAASNALADRLLSIAGDVMANPVATRIRAQIPMIQHQRAAEADAAAKLKSLEGKPLAVTGTTIDGKPFTSADWKGKVILVDFWATWCGPCKAELPRVKDIYAQYHSKGLEILGVSNDIKQDDLTDYTVQHQMPWPELFDTKAAEAHSWNPITLGYGIHGIPTMFLIDKKGVVRSVSADEGLEDSVPKLLAE